jgi:hypothetical protein
MDLSRGLGDVYKRQVVADAIRDLGVDPEKAFGVCV